VLTKITEHTIEDFAIKLLEHLGYDYIYAPNIALTCHRMSFGRQVLKIIKKRNHV
jgi:hypothetical protein